MPARTKTHPARCFDALLAHGLSGLTGFRVGASSADMVSSARSSTPTSTTALPWFLALRVRNGSTHFTIVAAETPHVSSALPGNRHRHWIAIGRRPAEL